MSLYIKRSKSSHWYNRDGTPMHTIIGANGKERSTDLRDARKLGLYPSVTSILSVLSKDGLNNWIIEQGILAALTLPRNDGEQLDTFANRVANDMDRERDQAADLGTSIHAAIMMGMTGFMVEPEMEFYFDQFKQWADLNDFRLIDAEKSGVSVFGFAGTHDLYGMLNGMETLLDIKSQNVKKGKPAFYDEWALQLAAYRQMKIETTGLCSRRISVVIDRNKVAPLETKEWENHSEDWGVFLSAFDIWKYRKGYDPIMANA